MSASEEAMSENRSLKQYLRENQTAGRLFDWLEESAGMSGETIVRVAADETGLDYYEIINVFRRFEELGLGAFKIGRRGAETRFEWSANFASSPRDSGDLGSRSEYGHHESSSRRAKLVCEKLPLRPGLVIEMTLPEVLSDREVEMLYLWLKGKVPSAQ